MKIAIIGGGLTGFATAWELSAQAGFQVSIFDCADDYKQSASYKSAGMLAPQLELKPHSKQFLQLLLAAKKQWQPFLANISHHDIATGYNRMGMIFVARTAEQQQWLKHRYDFYQTMGVGIEYIASDQVSSPLHPHITHVLLSREDHYINPRLLMATLFKLILASGVNIHYGHKVSIAELNNNFDRIIITAGAWSNQVYQSSSFTYPIRPIKGQMIELKQHDDASLVIQATWSQDLYIVPQQHNTLYIGASIEDKGFDEAITVAEIFNLLRQAIMIYPSIREASIIKTWSGFRAGSMDHAPVLCHDKQNKKIIWATGHHRNGILLAPLTAKAIKQLLLSGNVPEIWQGYGYDRWQ